MTVALIILCALVGVGALLYAEHRLHLRRQRKDEPEAQQQTPSQATEDGEECCGMHITCERDSLLAAVSKDIEYYDDEELDRFAGRGAEEYTDEEIEEFRDILLTMQASDIAGWGRSLQLRGINLPTPVRDELIMIVAEARQHVAVS